MDDLISRRAAIDALKRDEALVRAFGYQHAIDAVQALPSVESLVAQEAYYKGKIDAFNQCTAAVKRLNEEMK